MGQSERDSHSGYMTTGHEWNGITELNTPVSRIVLFFLIAHTIFSVGYTILMPAWPYGSGYTKGILGVDQRQEVDESLRLAAESRKGWEAQVAEKEIAEIQSDDALMMNVRQAGATLFGDNCAACHGLSATGGPGYPSLRDEAWLWGGAAEAVAETIRVGINSTHDDARSSEMLAFGRDQILQRSEIQDVVSYVRSLSDQDAAAKPAPDSVTAGKEIFAEHCVDCHGATAKGSIETGAPDLTDGFWIYGGDRDAIYRTVSDGRQGQMPGWEDRLSDLRRKVLTLYVLDLAGAAR
jgi:cytochrome c oxidase cbb3-type subunit III